MRWFSYKNKDYFKLFGMPISDKIRFEPRKIPIRKSLKTKRTIKVSYWVQSKYNTGMINVCKCKLEIVWETLQIIGVLRSFASISSSMLPKNVSMTGILILKLWPPQHPCWPDAWPYKTKQIFYNNKTYDWGNKLHKFYGLLHPNKSFVWSQLMNFQELYLYSIVARDLVKFLFAFTFNCWPQIPNLQSLNKTTYLEF